MDEFKREFATELAGLPSDIQADTIANAEEVLLFQAGSIGSGQISLQALNAA